LVSLEGTCRGEWIMRHRTMRANPLSTFRFSALTLCLLVAVVIPLPAQERDAANIRALELKWTESYKQHQIDILSSLLAEDFVITIEDGSIFSKAGYITHSADASVHVEVAELSDLKVRMHGDTAVVTGAYHERGESNGKRYEYHDRLTDVWMKIGGKWQVVASHYSVPLKQ
jgi:ketosteroid isomerase-like protein